MPGPYIHIAASDRIAERLARLKGWPRYDRSAGDNENPPEALARIIRDNNHEYSLGAIGPDLFFFLPDFRDPGLANSLIGVLKFLDDFYAKLDEWILTREERYLGPIWENADEAVSRLTGDLSTVVQEDLSKFSALLTTAILVIASQSSDWFGLFSLGLDRGYDNKDFFWSDMLHYRKTSRFGHALWTAAAGMEQEALEAGTAAGEARALGDRLRSYALGYMTHLGTDVTGHAFVNEKSGGPFRTHWQRHHLVENHMDAACYDQDHGSDAHYDMLATSALHYRLLFGDEATRTLPMDDFDMSSLRGRYDFKRQLDVDSEMPDEIAELVFRAMGTAYDTGSASAASVNDPSRTTPQIIPDGDGRPDAELIQHTFLLFFRYLKHVTTDGFSSDKPEPPEVFPNLDFPQLTDPQDEAPGASDHDPDFWDILLMVLSFLLWVVEVAVWLATVLPAVILDLGTYGPRVAAYYAIELPLYYMMKAERMVLVMTGYIMPLQDEINLGLVQIGTGTRGLFLEELAAMDDVLGGLFDLSATAPNEPAPDRLFPRAIKTDASGMPNEFHAPWRYPDSPQEAGGTIAGPHGPGDLPHQLLEETTAGSQALRSRLERAKTPTETDAIASRVSAGNNMGDPVHFSTYLIWQLARTKLVRGERTRTTDWNLDADRGYGYKCWDWDRCRQAEVVADQTGHPYLDTKGETPQKKGVDTVNPAYDPAVPLEIHYLDDDPSPLNCR